MSVTKYNAGFETGAADRRRNLSAPAVVAGDDADWARGYLAGWNQPQVRVIDMGNNESCVVGVQKMADGKWIALTYSRSRIFKTERGARMWFRAATGGLRAA